MSVKVQRLCNSRIDRYEIVKGIRFESLRITINDSRIPPESSDFTKYAEICTDMFPSDTPETNILAEIIHYGIETMHAMVRIGKDHDREAGQ